MSGEKSMICRSIGRVLASLALALITGASCELVIHPYLGDNVNHVNVGDEVKVYCRQFQDASSSHGSFQWTPSHDDDERVSIVEEEFYGGYQSILRIQSVAREHHNTYTCTYRNANGQIVESVSFDLIVLAPPRFLDCSEDQNVTQDQNGTVFCSVDLGEPPATVKWTRGGNPITSSRFEVIAEQGLLISNVREDDAGVYKCILDRNGLGAVPRNINIAVNDVVCHAAPVINTELLPSSLEIGYNHSLELTCSLQSGDATVFWSIPGIGHRPGPTLFVPAPPPSGLYLCIAQGDVGCPSQTASASVNVTVTAPPLPPTKNETKLAEIGEMAVLSCSIYTVPVAHPIPTYTWTKVGNTAPFPHGEGGRIRVDSSQKLHIARVEESDFGKYECVVENDKGMSLQMVHLVHQPVESGTITVTVETDVCDEQTTETHVTNDIMEILGDWCPVGDCSVMVVGDLQCCSKTHGIYRASVEAVFARSLVMRFNETKLHETNLDLTVCEEDCLCMEDETKADPQASEDNAATPGAIGGTLAFVLLAVVILAALAFCLIWQRRRKSKFSVGTGESSQGSADDVEAQTTPEYINQHVHLERAFVDPTPHLAAALPINPPSYGGSTSGTYSYPQQHCTVAYVPPHHHTLQTSAYHPPCYPCTAYTSAHHNCTCHSSPCHSHTSLTCCHTHHPSPHSTPIPSICTLTPPPPTQTGIYVNGGVTATGDSVNGGVTETAVDPSREQPGYVSLPLEHSSRTS